MAPRPLWPATEAFNRASIRADQPGEDAPWSADDDRLEATQADADASAKRFWQRASWYRRASIRNKSLAGQAVMDDVSTQGALYTDDLLDAATAGEIVARRRVEDERFAYFAEASVVFLDLPDAVFRGYEGDDQLLGAVRPDDDAPLSILRREIARLEPQAVYVPLAVGNHVDHQLCRDVGVSLLAEPRSWVMPGPEWAGTVVFYEDFPYAWWNNFQSLDDLPEGALDGIPSDVLLTPRYADIGDQMERKVRGISMYESQLDRLFGGEKRDGGRRPPARRRGGHDRPRQRPRRALLAQLPPVGSGPGGGALPGGRARDGVPDPDDAVGVVIHVSPRSRMPRACLHEARRRVGPSAMTTTSARVRVQDGGRRRDLRRRPAPLAPRRRPGSSSIRESTATLTPGASELEPRRPRSAVPRRAPRGPSRRCSTRNCSFAAMPCGAWLSVPAGTPAGPSGRQTGRSAMAANEEHDHHERVQR